MARRGLGRPRLPEAGVSGHLPRFVIAGPAAVGEVVTLTGDEARHARVRRLGARRGGGVVRRGRSQLRRRGQRHRPATASTVRVTAVHPADAGESPLALTLAIGLLKADKLDWVIEKATELGVARIQPVRQHAHARRNRPPRARRAGSRSRRSAAKQSGRSRVPAVAAPCALHRRARAAGGHAPAARRARRHRPARRRRRASRTRR